MIKTALRELDTELVNYMTDDMIDCCRGENVKTATMVIKTSYCITVFDGVSRGSKDQNTEVAL
jgi:hypothetical protein